MLLMGPEHFVSVLACELLDAPYGSKVRAWRLLGVRHRTAVRG